MRTQALSGLSVVEIMNRWPATIGVFLDLDMHCVGCPVGAFQTLATAAEEHTIPFDRLRSEIDAAIAGNRARAGRAPHRPRSAASGAGPSPGASAVPPPRGPPFPRR